MEYIYSFDALKKHTLSFEFVIEQYLEKANGVIDMFVTGVVKEVKDGKVLHKEMKSRTFSFKNKSDKQAQHDLNLSRIRYADEKKWILSVTNNESASEKLEVGIISETANKNPLFVDIYSKDKVYSYYIKGNNLAQLETGFVPPILEQTIVNYTFDQPGVPDGFIVDSSTFNNEMKAITTDGFNYTLPSDIQGDSIFTMKFNIVPTSLTGAVDGALFTVTIGLLGTLTVFSDNMSFLNTNYPNGAAINKTFKTPITDIKQLYDIVYKRESEVKFNGDGKGNLSISFNNEAMDATYDNTFNYNSIIMGGGIISESEDSEGNKIYERIKQNVDNISVTFKK